MKGLACVLVAGLVWLAGLLAFADRIARSTPAEPPAPADGIVALTGGSAVRLKAATDLLEAGEGQRLLVSGVDRRVSRRDLWALTGAAKPLFDCCVDLGFEAANTLGNARETSDWVRAMGYRSVILVTADYHTPRAVLDLRGALDGVRVEAYPVATPDLDARHWQESGRGAERMAAEYDKYLVTLARDGVLDLGAWVDARTRRRAA
ncbi:MAG: YdcF family protein [Alphaproteobacteria bacterium]|jgi:uncharacterized SAM-binding protein YcdF (DUF218 family)|nr:YdcF family protein [Alphaproteobacteria bacterium]